MTMFSSLLVMSLLVLARALDGDKPLLDKSIPGSTHGSFPDPHHGHFRSRMQQEPTGAIITNGASGQTDVVGLRYLLNEQNFDSILNDEWEAWALCGEGSSFIDSSTLPQVSFDADGYYATSAVDSADGLFHITHNFNPRDYIDYEVTVTITNKSPNLLSQVHYRRWLSWSIHPMPGLGCLTIQFDPKSNVFYASVYGEQNPWLEEAPFTNVGPSDDENANYYLNLGDLPAGGTLTFTMFWGAVGSETHAEIALVEVGAEFYSLFKPGTGDGTTGCSSDGPVFILAFSGVVGGSPVVGFTNGVPSFSGAGGRNSVANDVPVRLQ